MEVKIRYRNCCGVCSSENLSKVLSLPEMPLTEELISKELLGHEFRADIDVYVCVDCYAVQTQHNVDVTKYYENYQYSVKMSISELLEGLGGYKNCKL